MVGRGSFGGLFSPPFFPKGETMELKLYKTQSAKNEIGKVLTDEITMSINLRRGFDIFNPSLTLEAPQGVNFYDYNYLYLADLDRYYFINSVASANFKVWVLSCTVDVLETYKAEILAANVRYWRGIKTGDYITADLDSRIDSTITVFESDGGFTGGESMIMATIGEEGEE